MDGSDLRATVGRAGEPGQGPFMFLYLFAQGDALVEARFQTYGCPSARACGEWVCGYVKGRTIEDAARVDEASVALGLGGLSLGREFCASLASTALRNALAALKPPAEPAG
ncbi:MAG TPA: iron-sulfur cluster assembly scaffold protein [Chthonomonadales bacterium]|nr:iron-sulfur cluster assembly scaffold protein [Chthonomonadales bacterium]